eukprot:TRINITY_DN1243_c3_g1_i1.p1 TRINITY_DN1243_c3_g1~~TRINITY_DN1243_c3_g1_i1.p1  ORF type:complete len:293 (+),score=35.60 TRINITY_DN1243_c3_g1_i1:41-919(+)
MATAEDAKKLNDLELRSLPPVRFYFVRHAMSANNLGQKHNDERSGPTKSGRVADPGVTDAGLQQAALAGLYFKELNKSDVPDWQKIDSVHLSPMKRAVRTAEAQDLDLDHYLNDRLYEEGGLFEGSRTGESDKTKVFGLTKHVMNDMLNGRVKNIDAIGSYGPEGGWYNWRPRETMAETELRAKELVEWLWSLTSDRVTQRKNGIAGAARGILVITHGLIHDRVKRLLCSGGRAPGDTQELNYLTCNSGIDVFDFKLHPETGKRMLGIVKINDDTYIPRELRNGHTCGPFKI